MIAALSRLRRPGPPPGGAWVPSILLGAAFVLPAVTSLEFVTFRLMDITVNARVMLYFSVAAVAALAAVPTVVRLRAVPPWLALMVSLVAWLTFTALISSQGLIEWLPTVVRFVLYFSAAVIFYSYIRSLDEQRASEMSRLLPLVVLAATVIPAAAGVAEVIRGSAPILNGAPRISGSMPSHPVAYSLVLALGAIATMSGAWIRGLSRAAMVRWASIAALTLVVFATFTRLTVVLLVGAAVAVAALLPATRGMRASRVGAALVVGLAVVVLAQPLFAARFIHLTSLSTLISEPTPGPVGPGSSLPPAEEGLDVAVDASVAYRIMLTERGVHYVLQSPIVGHGPGSFPRLFEEESGRARVAAHNDFMTLTVDGGLPGLVLYLAVILAVALALRVRRVSGVPDSDALRVTALVALGAFNVGASIHNPLYFVELQLGIWIIVGAGLGIASRVVSGDGARRGAPAMAP